MQVYLDNSATTSPLPEVIDAINEVLTTQYGNPSSLYSLGLSAEKILKSARENVAKTLNANPNEVYFTSCGTESDNTAIFSVWKSKKKQGTRVITTAVEHPAILRCCEALAKDGADVVYIPVHEDGTFNMDEFKNAFNANTILVSIMHVNNESGAIFPIEEIGNYINDFAKKNNCDKAVFHSDCVQSYGKIPIDVKKLKLDMVSISGHKVHGPKGVGALYIRDGLHVPSYIYGGGQEKGFRSGTENMPGIAGLGMAAKLILEDKNRASRMQEIKDYMLSRITEEIPNIKINTPKLSVPSVLNISFLDTRGEVLLHTLEQDEIYVSTGSACSSKSKGSHVLRAMNLSPSEIEGAVRFSFSELNTKDQIDFAVEKIKAAVESQRKLRSLFHK